MWKLAKINIYKKQLYNKKSSVESRHIKRLLEAAAKFGFNDIFEEIFVPSSEFGKDGNIDITLSGFFFVKFKKESEPMVSHIFKYCRIFLEEPEIDESLILKMKERINESFKEQEGKNSLNVGDLVDILDSGISSGKIISITDDIATVGFFLFGQENRVNVHVSSIVKINTN